MLSNLFQAGRSHEKRSPYMLDKDVIINDLSRDHPQWILSAYGPGKDAPAQLFGGSMREQSFEEMRLYHYQAAAAGNEQQAIQEAQLLVDQAYQQMQVALNDPEGAINYITACEELHPNRRDICGKPSAPGYSARSSSIPTQPTQQNPVSIGAGPWGGATGAFTKPLIVTSGASSGTFSQLGGGAMSTFGQPSQPGVASSALGQPPQQLQRTAAFGQPSQLGGATSSFGQPSQLGGGATSTFGQPSQLGGGATSAFGQPSQLGGGATSTFGQPSQLGAASSAFGQPSQLGGGATSTFGQPSQLGAASSAFGQPSQLGGGSLSNNQTVNQIGTGFGAPTQTAGESFGQPSQLQRTDMGQSQSSRHTFGQTSTLQTPATATGDLGGPSAQFHTNLQTISKPPGTFGLSSQPRVPVPAAGDLGGPSAQFHTNLQAISKPPGTFGLSSQPRVPAPATSNLGAPPAQSHTSLQTLSSGPSESNNLTFGQVSVPQSPATTMRGFGVSHPSMSGLTLPSTPQPMDPLHNTHPSTRDTGGITAQPASGSANTAQVGSTNTVSGGEADLGRLNRGPCDPQRYSTRDTSNVLLTWKSRLVKYIDGYACFKRDDGRWERIWFPDGPPVFDTVDELPEEMYDKRTKEAYLHLREHGAFKDGWIPSLPPKQQWCAWDI